VRRKDRCPQDAQRWSCKLKRPASIHAAPALWCRNQRWRWEGRQIVVLGAGAARVRRNVRNFQVPYCCAAAVVPKPKRRAIETPTPTRGWDVWGKVMLLEEENMAEGKM